MLVSTCSPGQVVKLSLNQGQAGDVAKRKKAVGVWCLKKKTTFAKAAYVGFFWFSGFVVFVVFCGFMGQKDANPGPQTGTRGF